MATITKVLEFSGVGPSSMDQMKELVVFLRDYLSRRARVGEWNVVVDEMGSDWTVTIAVTDQYKPLLNEADVEVRKHAFAVRKKHGGNDEVLITSGKS